MQGKFYDEEQPQPGLATFGTIGSLLALSLPALGAQPTLGILALVDVPQCPASSEEPEAVHPLLADLERFDEAGRAATLH
jgi:hypothetical protein